jgi:hypothetical protein
LAIVFFAAAEDVVLDLFPYWAVAAAAAILAVAAVAEGFYAALSWIPPLI